MPCINIYRCEKCEFKLPPGCGGYMYVIDNGGGRIKCPHPGEWLAVKRILGFNVNAFSDEAKKRTGFNSHCVCLECLNQFDLDLGTYRPVMDEELSMARDEAEYLSIAANKPHYYVNPRDERICPQCGSEHVKTSIELVWTICPQCKEGLIIEAESGI